MGKKGTRVLVDIPDGVFEAFSVRYLESSDRHKAIGVYHPTSKQAIRSAFAENIRREVWGMLTDKLKETPPPTAMDLLKREGDLMGAIFRDTFKD